MLTFQFMIYVCNFLLRRVGDSVLVMQLKISKRLGYFAVSVPVLVSLSSAYLMKRFIGFYYYLVLSSVSLFVRIRLNR